MSFNTTTPFSYYQSLYASTDLTALNWFEKQWMGWYIWIGNPVIATGLLSFLVHEVTVA
jgi:methylsterol monooxygenase